MANKIDNLLSAIRTRLAELIETGVLKAVESRVLNPLTEQAVPVASLVFTGATRQGGAPGAREWNAEAMLMICTVSKSATCDASITEIIGCVEEALDDLPSDGTAYGTVDLPRFDAWHSLNLNLARVGAWCTLRLRVSGPLLIPEDPEE